MDKDINSLPLQAAYDRWAETYDDADPSTLLDEPFLLLMVKLFRGCRVLDLGCGTGRYLLEPSVDQELVARCPVWKDRLGCPALALLAAQKSG